MPLTIRYKDSQGQHEVECDTIQSDCIIRAVQNYMQPLMLSDAKYPDFDLMLIDLSDESIEEVHCFKTGQPNRRVCSFGGAMAWNIYRQTAEVWPQINYHTSGRPAVIL